MSEARHTPGPWEFRAESGYCSQIDGANGHTICCFDEDPSPQDAALMSSAPELLEALKAATDALAGGLWDYGPGQDEHEKCNEVIESCRAAIAKATS